VVRWNSAVLWVCFVGAFLCVSFSSFSAFLSAISVSFNHVFANVIIT
jgi:hypothetical protein